MSAKKRPPIRAAFQSKEYAALARVAVEMYAHKRKLFKALSEVRADPFVERAEQVQQDLIRQRDQLTQGQIDEISLQRFYDVFHCNPAEFQAFAMEARDAARRFVEAFPTLGEASDPEREAAFQVAVGPDNPVVTWIGRWTGLTSEAVAEAWRLSVADESLGDELDTDREKRCALTFAAHIAMALSTYASTIVGCVASAALPPAFMACYAVATASYFLALYGAQRTLDDCVSE